MPKKSRKVRESLDETLGRKLTFRFKGNGSRQITQFWVRRTSMICCSKVVLDACKQNPELRDFNEPDVDDISGVFPLVRQFVHEDVVPIGPGAAVGCLSREATVYIHQMFRLYRFAVQYDMEDLADRTIDEIQAHEFRCRGYLRMQWIVDVYRSTKPGSMLRLYCAASLYHSGIRTFDRELECHRLSNFKLVRDEFPEIVDDINRMADVFKTRSTFDKGFNVVDHRDQKAFGMCVFHIHQPNKVCHARSRIARVARTWGRGWGNWEMVRTDVEFPTVYPADNGSDTESDNDSVDEDWKAMCDLDDDDDDEVAEKITKHTSPEFTDSAFSGGEEGEALVDAIPSSSTVSAHAHAGKVIMQKTKKTSLESADSARSGSREKGAIDTTPNPTNSAPSAHTLGGHGEKKELQITSKRLLGGDVGSVIVEKKQKQSLPAFSQLPGGNVSEGKFAKRKKMHSASPCSLSGPANPPSQKDQPEDQLLNELLESVSKSQAEDDELSEASKEVTFKGLDRYFPKLTRQQFEAQQSQAMHTPTQTKRLPKSVLRPHPQVFQTPSSGKPEIFGCKTCERTFARKEDFLKHISQKNKLCTIVERKRPRSDSLAASLTPMERIRQRPRLDYRYGY